MTIALLTDFGLKDAYVGMMKAVLYSIHPEAAVIDITHEVTPFSRGEAGLFLFQAYWYFPQGTIFVVVVDPGVGSERTPLLVRTEKYDFIGPDNGVLSLALSAEKIHQVLRLNRQEFFQQPVSATFHGRDIFCPVAAHLSKGVAAEDLGEAFSGYFRLPDFFPATQKNYIAGKILSIDRFGNAITNLQAALLKRYFPDLKIKVILGTTRKVTLQRLLTYYAEAPDDKPFLLFNSSGFLEIAAREANAAKLLKVKSGDKIKILLKM